MNMLLMQVTTNEKPLVGILHHILTFLYFLAHQLGVWIMMAFKSIIPNVSFPDTIIDPLGFLIILTLFLLLVSVAKKIAWIIVIVGWVLLIIRIIMIIFQIG